MSAIALTFVKTLIMCSILFVWVVRYDNIIEEFKQYKLPAWLRDIVGILKITAALLLQSSDEKVVEVGALIIVTLMFFAMATHIRVKNPIHKMLPSLTLFSLSAWIVFFA